MGKRGEKLCGNPTCLKPCGPSSKKCPSCGFEFSFKKKDHVSGKNNENTNTNTDDVKQETKVSQGIIAIAGPPPIYPENCENPSEQDIHNWIEDLQTSVQPRQFYERNCILYFANKIWPRYSKGCTGPDEKSLKIDKIIKEYFKKNPNQTKITKEVTNDK